MSLSNPKQISTKAGVVLTADAMEKLQALATWLESELTAPPTRATRYLAVSGVMSQHTGTTYVSATGALVQMFRPFRKADARHLGNGTYRLRFKDLVPRLCDILELTSEEVFQLFSFIQAKKLDALSVAKQIRAL